LSVKLPLINTPASETLNDNSTEAMVQLNRFHNFKILVVEDEVDSRDILSLVLEKEGADVTAVTSAKEALEAFTNSDFDLMISDIGMPEVDGYTLMKQIRNLPQGKNIQAIALTAYAGDVNKQHSIDAGYQKHLAKPININELISIITSLLSSS